MTEQEFIQQAEGLKGRLYRTAWLYLGSEACAVDAVIMLVLFFVFYALLRLLVSMLVTVLGLVNKLPVVGTVNRGLGWLVGGGTALMDIYLVLCVVWGLVVITGGSLSVLNDTVMSGSLYYKVFNLFNPFL